ncbi:MAG: pyridoxamine 5'-phosphate oxidase family protein [Chloroflexota bacterium]|nr:pyridoxamine 5'-phosphate oxidase family protein [Chloroflexota bacterium]
MEVATFAEIEPIFTQRIQQMVWCNVATVDMRNRPRSRILHPLWEGMSGWITTRRNMHKAKHLAHNPFVSLAYIADVAKPVYVDCKTEWIEGLAQKQHVWNLCLETAPPLGFDPALIYQRADHPDFAVLKLMPWRIDLVNPPAEHIIWRAPLETP